MGIPLNHQSFDRFETSLEFIPRRQHDTAIAVAQTVAFDTMLFENRKHLGLKIQALAMHPPSIHQTCHSQKFGQLIHQLKTHASLNVLTPRPFGKPTERIKPRQSPWNVPNLTNAPLRVASVEEMTSTRTSLSRTSPRVVAGMILIALAPLAFSQALVVDPLHSVMEQHCLRCHGEEKAKGGLNLATLLQERPLIKNRDRWTHVIDLLKSGDMPPEDEPQPNQSQRQLMLHHLDQALNHFDFSTIDHPGFEQARRLTHQEYNRTVSDLFSVPQRPADRFPSDMTGASGFDNSANTLFLPTALMERYIAAAERVVETALPPSLAAAKKSPAFQRIFIKLPGPNTSVREAAQANLKSFLLRAYRRPPEPHEIRQALNYFTQAHRDRSGNEAFIEAIKRVIEATLISPKFLLRTENAPAGMEPQRISNYELASRLSYFLWSTMPDDELFAVAAKGRLHQETILVQQVERMLKSPKAKTLGSTFAAQWLGFRFIGNRVRLDPIDNPWCTDSLMTAMREESSLFFSSLIQENRSLDDLINANHTYLNEELARTIYQRDDIQGPHMRRVALQDPNRGGILTHGSLMAITSNYKETSPIKRGNWILETVLGRPLPPPPPNAGAFKEEVEEDDSLTFRQKVELHSSDPSCRSCHRKIDPLGFSLENFDYFGRWREAYRVRLVERNDEEALALAQAMRKLSLEALHQRIDDLDSGPETRQRIRDRLGELRALSDWALEKELTETITVSQQNQLIRLLEWLEIGEEEERELNDALTRLRAVSEQELGARIKGLELDEEDRRDVYALLIEFRAATPEQIEKELEHLRGDDEDELFELFDALNLLSDEGEKSVPHFITLVSTLRQLDSDELGARIEALELDDEEAEEIWIGANFLRGIPDDKLEATLMGDLDEAFREEATELLLAMELGGLDDDEAEERPRRRRSFEMKPITGEASLPDGTRFQGPQGLRKVILEHHREDLTRQLTRKMLAYALGRQLEYYDERAIRKILQSVADRDGRMTALIMGIVTSYPFQFKKQPGDAH